MAQLKNPARAAYAVREEETEDEEEEEEVEEEKEEEADVEMDDTEKSQMAQMEATTTPMMGTKGLPAPKVATTPQIGDAAVAVAK